MIDDADAGSDTVTTPDGQTIDVADIMASFSKVRGAINSAISDYTKTFSDLQSAGQQEQTGINEAATAQAEVNAIDARVGIATQRKNAQAAADFGVNPDASSYVLAALGHKMLSEKADLDARDKVIQQKMDTGFFDDPLSFIANQFTLPLEVAAYNNKAKAFNQDSDTVTRLTANASEAMTINNAIKEKDSLEKLHAVNSALFAKAAVDVAKSKMELARYGLEGINVRLAADKAQFDTMLSLNSALNQKMELDLRKNADERAQETLNIQKQLRDVQIKEHQVRLEDRQRQTEAEVSLQDRLDKATSVLGLNKITLNQFKLMTGKMKDDLQNIMLIPDLDEGRIGNSTAQIVDRYNALNVPLTAGQNIVRKQLVDIINTETKAQAAQGVDLGKRSEGEREALLQPKVKEAVRREYANIPDSGGIYSAPPLVSTLSIPAVANLKIAKDLAPIAAANPEYATSADTVYKTALNKVINGEMTPAEAAGEISTMYNAINLDNTSNRQYRKFAILAPTKFNTSLHVSSGWGGSKVVDMTNAAQLEGYITREVMFQQSYGSKTAASNPASKSGGTEASSVDLGEAASSVRDFFKRNQTTTLFGVPLSKTGE